MHTHNTIPIYKIYTIKILNNKERKKIQDRKKNLIDKVKHIIKAVARPTIKLEQRLKGKVG